MDYNELQNRVDKYSNNIKARRKESYHYAREKGFTPKEAMVLASKNKEEIDKLAKERDDGKVADGA